MEHAAIQRLAARMGVATPAVISKAEEYLRLSQVKCATLLVQMTATSSAVICLDLAASFMKHSVDKSYVVKLSGLNKATYQSCLRSFESLLGLRSNVSIRELAVQFGCMEAINMASKLLQRCLKLKVDKGKMVTTSGVKKAIFDRLCGQLEKISQHISRENSQLAVEAPKPEKTLHTCLGKEDAAEVKVKAPDKLPKRAAEPDDDYEEWKRRILENAAKAQQDNV